jgi:hypothetical protein
MKTVVSLQDLVDREIHPGPLVQEFRALTAASVAALLQGPLQDMPCQACGRDESVPAFEKFGLRYRVCSACASVFASPRPSAAALAEYAAASPAATFWRDRILTETRTARAEKLTRPRAEWVADAVAEYCPDARVGMDLSPSGMPLQADLRVLAPDLSTFRNVHASDRGWTRQGPVDVVTAFDTLDRAADVRALVADVASVLRPGGLFFVTAPCISGFDLQVLWDRSSAILPPEKLNLLSIEGFAHLFEGGSWQIRELSTPGVFDVDNVRQAILSEPDIACPRVVRGLVLQPSPEARLELQEYLQRHRLASFARLVVRRA